MEQREQNGTDYPIVFLMVDSTDHITGKTGLTPTVTLSKNGGAFGAAAGAVTELANGWYSLAGNATDRNTLGSLAIHASATGADPSDILVFIVGYDPIVQEGNGGTLTLTYTVNKSGGGVLEGATVKLYSDSTRETLVNAKITDVLGQVTFTNLVAGTYYLTTTMSGYTDMLDSEVVS